MKRPIIITLLILITMFMGGVESVAQQNNYITVKPTLDLKSLEELKPFERVDAPPVFPGNMVEGIPKFMRRHFKYPKEAWKVEKRIFAEVQAVIKEDGSMSDIQYTNISHPELIAELTRVMGKMTWYPAYDKGEKVSVRCKMLLPLFPGKELDDLVINAAEYAKALDNPKCGYDDDKMSAAMETIRDAAQLFPDVAQTSVAYLRLASSRNKGLSALADVDSCINKIHHGSYTDSLRAPGEPSLGPGLPFSQGRRGLAWYLARAVTHQYTSSDSTDSAYDTLVRLIYKRMEDGDVGRTMTEREYEQSERRIEQMKRELVNEWSQGNLEIDRNTQTYEKVSRFFSVDELTDTLSYWAGRGEIPNAGVSQLAALIRQEKERMHSGTIVTGKDGMRLFGVMALVKWLREGSDGLKQYIAEINDGKPTRQVKKYLTTLEKRYNANATLLADHEGALQALACLVPPDGVDTRQFYARRKALEEVFPLRWLMVI